MFTVALFTKAKTWKPPECPSTDEQIRKMWRAHTHTHTHTHTGILLSLKNKNEIMLSGATWMDLRDYDTKLSKIKRQIYIAYM